MKQSSLLFLILLIALPQTVLGQIQDWNDYLRWAKEHRPEKDVALALAPDGISMAAGFGASIQQAKHNALGKCKAKHVSITSQWSKCAIIAVNLNRIGTEFLGADKSIAPKQSADYGKVWCAGKFSIWQARPSGCGTHKYFYNKHSAQLESDRLGKQSVDKLAPSSIFWCANQHSVWEAYNCGSPTRRFHTQARAIEEHQRLKAEAHASDNVETRSTGTAKNPTKQSSDYGKVWCASKSYVWQALPSACGEHKYFYSIKKAQLESERLRTSNSTSTRDFVIFLLILLVVAVYVSRQFKYIKRREKEKALHRLQEKRREEEAQQEEERRLKEERQKQEEKRREEAERRKEAELRRKEERRREEEKRRKEAERRKEEKRRQEQERRRKEAERRKEEERRRFEAERATLTGLSPKICAAAKDLHVEELSSHAGLTSWRRKYSRLASLKDISVKIRKESSDCKDIELILSVLSDPKSWRAKHNDQFASKEKQKYKQLFDSIEKYPLTERQRDAIVFNENRCLTVAGAGTGKTSTVVGRVKYLLEKQWCAPEAILVLSYNKETTRELEQRLVEGIEAGVAVKTMHKLGKDIISECKAIDPGVIDDKEIPHNIQKYLQDLIETDTGCEELIDYLAYYYFPERYEFEFESGKDQKRFATQNNLESLRPKTVGNDPHVTLKREKVKSIEEVKLANWLYLNGVNYEYEPRFKKPDGGKVNPAYYPDFYLPDYQIYIEHFGVDKDGTPRPGIDKQKYNDSIKWKRELHKQYGTTLEETYSYQFRSGTIFALLEKTLKKHRVELRRRSPEQIRQLRTVNQSLNGLAKLIQTFLSHYKENPGLIEQKLLGIKEQEHPREFRFLGLFRKVLTNYEQELKQKDLIDFGDMMNQASELVEANDYHSPYHVVIVDEYQDISRARDRLVESLLKNRPDTRFLCVGDDWQAIYRFSGGDVSLMTGAQERFADTKRIDLDRSFRFPDKLLDLSTKFITKNPGQLKKSLTSQENAAGPVVHISSQPLEEIYERIVSTDPNKEIFSLGRYNKTTGEGHRKSGWNDQLEPKLPDWNRTYPPNVEHHTIHKSKGLEADYVIVNRMNSGGYGFPSARGDDPIISLVLPEPDEFPDAEERRLFYVALTRAKKQVWLTVPPGTPPSEFIVELLENENTLYRGLIKNHGLDTNTKFRCPKCDSLMRELEGNAGEKYLWCFHGKRCGGVRPGCRTCKTGIMIREPKSSEAQCSNESCRAKGEACDTCDTGVIGPVEIPGRKPFPGCSAWRYDECRYVSWRR